MNRHIITGGIMTMIFYLVTMQIPFFKTSVRRSGNLTMCFVLSVALLGTILGVLKLLH